MARERLGVTLEDLLSLKHVTSLALSPSGEDIAYVSDGAIWLTSTIRGAKARKVAVGAYPVWAPDSQRLAYISVQSGSAQIWLLNTKSLACSPLTSVAGGIDADPFSTWLPNADGPIGQRWSPDGEAIAFVSQTEDIASNSRQPRGDSSTSPLVLDRTTPPDWTLGGVFAHNDLIPGWAPKGTRPAVPRRVDDLRIPVKYSHVFVVNVRTRKIDQLTGGEGVEFDPDWSPDGRTIAFAASDHAVRYGATQSKVIRTIDLGSRAVADLTPGSGDRRRPRWSPDGNWIAYLGGSPLTNNQVSIVSKDGIVARQITTREEQPYGFEWFGARATLAINYLEGVTVGIALSDLQEPSAPPVVLEPSGLNLYMDASISGAIAWEHSDGTVTGGLMAQSPGEGEPHLVAELNPQVKDWRLGSQEVVRWKNSQGAERTGVLIKPVAHPEGQRYPLIVDVYPQQVDGFKGEPLAGNQAWASRGYGVFFPNPPAPHFTGFASSNDRFVSQGPKGWDAAADDIETGLESLIDGHGVDADRIGILGFSNGGGVANYIITRSARFKCAVSIAGVMPDWSLPVFLTTDSPVPAIAGGITPWMNPAAYAQLSAVFHLDKVGIPILLAVGDNDGHETLLGVIEMFNGLRAAGADVTLLRYPHQGHGFNGPALANFWGREQAFFDGCVMGRSSDTH